MSDTKSDTKDSKADGAGEAPVTGVAAPSTADTKSAAAAADVKAADGAAVGVELVLSESANKIAAHIEKQLKAHVLTGGKAPLTEKEILINNLKKALDEDDYVQVFDALEAAEKKGLAEHKVALEAQSKLALYMKQMEVCHVMSLSCVMSCHVMSFLPLTRPSSPCLLLTDVRSVGQNCIES